MDGNRSLEGEGEDGDRRAEMKQVAGRPANTSVKTHSVHEGERGKAGMRGTDGREAQRGALRGTRLLQPRHSIPTTPTPRRTADEQVENGRACEAKGRRWPVLAPSFVSPQDLPLLADWWSFGSN